MSEGTGIPDLSTIIARVSENPQAMSMLSSLLGGEGSKEDALPHEEAPQHTNETKDEEEASAPVLSPAVHPRRGGRHEDRRRLLSALKPFLSRERQNALETLLLVLEATAMLAPRKEPPCT